LKEPLAPYQLNSEERIRRKKARNEKFRFLRITEKLLRAYGGCLGAKCRRRTWDTAKSLG
jgi:hypothetical protein